MKQKGFTLIELLGVIVILSLLMVIVFSNIINSLKKSRNEADNDIKKLVYSAVDLYMDDSEKIYEKRKGAQYCISVSSLVNNGYLKDPLTLSDGKTELKDIKTVEVKYNSESKKFDYNLKNNNECIELDPYICEAVTQDTKTIGNIPQGDYEYGDEYICEVSPGVNYHFFVVSFTTEKVNLLMNSNINKKGQPVTQDTIDKGMVAWSTLIDYVNAGGEPIYDWKDNYYGDTDKGPITAMKYLEEATKSWINIEDLDEIYNGYDHDDEEETYRYSMKLTGKARLPKYEEVSCLDDYSTNECRSYPWLFDSLEEPSINPTLPHGYWTLTTFGPCDVWNVNYHGGDLNKEALTPEQRAIIPHVDPIYVETLNGVRPVISVSKDDIKN